MNLFVEYSKDEVEYLLSLVDEDYEFNIPLFKGLLKSEVEEICKYISIEVLPEKKVIEKFDLIWVLDGVLVELENRVVRRKFYKDTLIGFKNKFLKENKKTLITLKKSKLIFFDIKEIHNELTSKFYKNLTLYFASNFSEVN